MRRKLFSLVGATASLIGSSIFCWLISILMSDSLIALDQFHNFQQIFMFLKFQLL